MARKKKSDEEIYAADIPEVCQRVVKYIQRCDDAESSDRADAKADAIFRDGDQWPTEIQNSRTLEARPLITINKTNAFCQQLVNNYRQQRPRIKVHAVNDEADYKIAQIIQGVVRHIEVQSDADTAYDTGVDSAITIGWGYWRVIHDYVRPNSFDQEIYIRPIPNTFSVRFDPLSVAIDGSDAEECAIEEDMSKELFRTYYPDKDDGASFISANGQDMDGWITKDTIRVCEYFWTVRELKTLCLYSNGKTAWKDASEGYNARLAKNGIKVIAERQSYKKTIKWAKVTKLEILEEREWPGRFIPVVPVYGNISFLTGKKKKSGAVRQMKDPARMYNFERTAYIESVAMAPKAKWLMEEGQDEGHENEWAQANIKATAVLHYKRTNLDDQPASIPQRIQPEPPPAGIMQGMIQSNQDLLSVAGIVDPAQRVAGNVSGKALNGEKQQSDNNNFHYFDNATKSQAYTGRIILDLIPKIYDQKRVIRIIGDDGRPDLVTINEQKEVDEILNDVTVGEYDVIMETGPGYNSKRQESLEALMPLMAQNEKLFDVAGDLVFRNFDFSGADTIADRLAASNPLAQIDDKSEIPPQVQMKLKQQEQQIQQMGQQLQAAQLEIKHKAGIKQMEEQGKDKRELMKLTAQSHKTEQDNETKRYDTEMTAISAMDLEELRSHMSIINNIMNKSAQDSEQTELNE